MTMRQEVTNRRPIAVYTDIDDTDISSGVELLEAAGYEVRVLRSRDPQKIISGARDAEALLPGYSEINREIIEALPRLRIIALMSMGTNTVDLKAAADHNVWVTNVLGAATEEVGTHTLAMILALLLQFPYYLAKANPAHWNSRAPHPPPRLSELTLGVVGLGRTGRELVRIAAPLFGEIVGYDPVQSTSATGSGDLSALVTRMELYEVVRVADVISLHLPLPPSTKSLVNADFINQIKPRAYLVNASRGGLIDEQALATALDGGHLSGAALDVLSTEPPPPDHPLVERPDVILTPHVAYYSERTVTGYVDAQARNVVAFKESGLPLMPVTDVNS